MFQTDADEFLNGLAIKLFIKVNFILELQRQQMHKKSYKLLFDNKVSLVAFAKNLVDDVLDDGSLRCEKELVVNL